jgi:hypothetical protein
MKKVYVPENTSDCIKLALEDFRVKADMTQQELARRLGISQSAYSRWVSCDNDAALDAGKILAMGEPGMQIMQSAMERARSEGLLKVS